MIKQNNPHISPTNRGDEGGGCQVVGPSNVEISNNNNNPYIIQNGNIYQLTSNNQLIPARSPGQQQTIPTVLEIKNSPAINSNAKNLIINSLQPANATQRIKMTTIKNGTSFLNLNTSKGKVIYKTTNDSGQINSNQQVGRSINMMPNFASVNAATTSLIGGQPKQIIIQTNNPSSTSRLSALINNNNNNSANQNVKQVPNTTPSVIVLTPQNNRPTNLNDSNTQNNSIQYIIQQKPNKVGPQSTEQLNQQQQQQVVTSTNQQQKPTVYFSINSINNLKNTNTISTSKMSTLNNQNKVKFFYFKINN